MLPDRPARVHLPEIQYFRRLGGGQAVGVSVGEHTTSPSASYATFEGGRRLNELQERGAGQAVAPGTAARRARVLLMQGERCVLPGVCPTR